MTLKITHTGTHRGKKLYTVTDGCDRFFTGTIDEVKRFVLLHNLKVRERREAADALLASVRAG